MQRATERRERFLVGRRGQPAVVIMSVEDYADAIAPAPDWLETAWKEGGANRTGTLKSGPIGRQSGNARHEHPFASGGSGYECHCFCCSRCEVSTGCPSDRELRSWVYDDSEFQETRWTAARMPD
jgi:hypothetical protein